MEAVCVLLNLGLKWEIEGENMLLYYHDQLSVIINCKKKKKKIKTVNKEILLACILQENSVSVFKMYCLIICNKSNYL